MSTFNNIKTSAANKEIVSELTRKFNLGPENVIARLALAYSLASGQKFTIKDMKDAKGKEYSKNVLFGNNFSHYLAMMCTHYNVYKTDKDIPKYFKMHIDHGLELISKEFQKSQTLTGFDFLINKVESGLSMLNNESHGQN